MDQRALEYVAPYCDIKARLSAAPHAARVRGIGFFSIIAALEETQKPAGYADASARGPAL